MSKIFNMVFVMMMVLGLAACNIVPKSVQYQKEEEGLIGSIDIVNPVVEEVQVALSGLGYDTENKDGRMNQKTREAIKEFQESVGIKSTGYLNKDTIAQIDEIRRSNEEKALGKEYDVKVRRAGLKPTTKDIQAALKNAGFDPGSIDGKMGPKTRQAVMEFQKAKGLNADGVVGSKTWTELGKYLKI